MSDKFLIRLAVDRVDTSLSVDNNIPNHVFTPGENITELLGFIRGHGTYVDGKNLKSSVAGIEERVDKLISIKPIKSRYDGKIGDVIVGRVTEVQQKRWKVDTNGRLDSILMISSVNLPGGELRRRSVEDEQLMRQYLQEGDLISAEVQNIYSDGSLVLHTRSLKYGKLSQGVLIKVPPSLVKRRKTHFYENLPCCANMIIGNNGFIWISPKTVSEENDGGFAQNLEQKIQLTEREDISRLRNCILALAQCKIMLYDTSIIEAFEKSQRYTVKELLIPESILDLALLTQQGLRLREDS